MHPRPQMATLTMVIILAGTASQTLQAQQDPWELTSEIELGAVYTSGNTDNENLRFSSRINAEREQWRHRVSLDGFRSSQNDELAAQRFQTVAETEYDYSEFRFVEGRAAYEEDRFSGFDSQADASVSYGQLLLQGTEDMEWDYTVGLGARQSRSSVDEDDFTEGFLRLATEYDWEVSDNARVFMDLSMEAADRNTITRSEAGLETDVMDNLSMSFTVNMRNQSEVPEGRAHRDTETAITVLLRL